MNTGKNVEGTKRKIKWRFCWDEDPDVEHEVLLIHSLVSGKKTIFENGKEITSSSNLLATEFAHGWNALVKEE